MDVVVREVEPNGQRKDRIYQYHEIETHPIFQNLFNLEGGLPCEILFLTGNKNKVIELEQAINLKYVQLKPLDIDLLEIQDSESLNIVHDKCKRAYEHINKSPYNSEEIDDSKNKDNFSSQINRLVLVEDTSLNFQALNGLPGPYVKWFMKAIGPIGLHKMLSGFEDKSAEAVCTYALMADLNRIVYFRGIALGRITEPRGSSWGWDPIFEEERSSLTFGEMSPEIKSKFSHRSNALTILRKYLTTLEERIKRKR